MVFRPEHLRGRGLGEACKAVRTTETRRVILAAVDVEVAGKSRRRLLFLTLSDLLSHPGPCYKFEQVYRVCLEYFPWQLVPCSGLCLDHQDRQRTITGPSQVACASQPQRSENRFRTVWSNFQSELRWVRLALNMPSIAVCQGSYDVETTDAIPACNSSKRTIECRAAAVGLFPLTYHPCIAFLIVISQGYGCPRCHYKL